MACWTVITRATVRTASTSRASATWVTLPPAATTCAASAIRAVPDGRVGVGEAARPGSVWSSSTGCQEPGGWSMDMTGFGECLPREDNFAALSDQTDEFGIPVLRIHCTWGDNELAMRKDMAASAGEMLEAAGVKDVRTYDAHREGGLGAEPGLGIHEMGTARMGRDPKTWVLNAHNQAHDAPNLFVTDGACMASSSCVNPAITYMALTARACDYAVGELKRGNL